MIVYICKFSKYLKTILVQNAKYYNYNAIKHVLETPSLIFRVREGGGVGGPSLFCWLKLKLNIYMSFKTIYNSRKVVIYFVWTKTSLGLSHRRSFGILINSPFKLKHV